MRRASGDQHTPARQPNLIAVAALLLLVSLALVAPIPTVLPETGPLFDLLHAPAFAVLAIFVYRALDSRSSRSNFTCAIATLCLLGLLGVLTEYVQQFVGRQPSWSDAFANGLGATAGIVWCVGAVVKSRRWKMMCRTGAAGLIVIGVWNPGLRLSAVLWQRAAMPQLASFESNLERFHWSAREGRIAFVPSHATHGNRALQVNLTAGTYPGISLRPVPPNWRTYERLRCDVFLDGGPALELIVKIHDVLHTGEPDDRFHQTERLTPGWNEIRVDLATVATAPRERRLDLGNVALLQFFVVRPPEPRTLYFDNVRLE